MRESQSSTRTGAHLLYPHNATMPRGKAAIAALQQTIAMFVGCITPALIFSSVVGIDAPTQSYLISICLLASGLGTFLQAKRLGIIGSGLLSINGTSFAYVDLLLRAGAEGGLPLACGMALAAVPLQFGLAFSLPALRSIISPLVAGIVVLAIGIDLIPVSGYYITKDSIDGTSWSSSTSIALIVVVSLIVSQISKLKQVRMYGPIIAIALGYVISGIIGIIEWPSWNTGKWITIPRPLAYGLDFKWELLIPFAIIYVVSSIEAIGDLTATASLSGMPTKGLDFWKRIRGGVLSDAITSSFSCLFNGFPTATFSQNNGVIQLTGVGCRQVGYYVSGILVIAAIIPQTGYFFSAMPNPVLGGVTLVLFGMIAGAGVRMIFQEPLTEYNMLTIAVSLGLAFSIPSQEQFVDELPEFLGAIFSSKVATAGLAAMTMNFIVSKVINKVKDK